MFLCYIMGVCAEGKTNYQTSKERQNKSLKLIMAAKFSLKFVFLVAMVLFVAFFGSGTTQLSYLSLKLYLVLKHFQKQLLDFVTLLISFHSTLVLFFYFVFVKIIYVLVSIQLFYIKFSRSIKTYLNYILT